GRKLVFRLPTGVEIGTESAVLKGALMALSDAWPLGRTAPELFELACTALRERGLSPPGESPEADASKLREDLELLVAAGHIELRLRQIRFPHRVDARPRLHALSRLLLEEGGYVATPRHEIVALSRHGRTIAAACDGTRDLDEVVAEVTPAFMADPPVVAGEGEPPLGPEDLRRALPGYVASVVMGLARSGAFAD
ncbi:MAG: hypothetical protein R3B70_23980, partial [Polyangiaceae bacterium]